MIDLWVDGRTAEQTAERNDISRSQVFKISDKRLPSLSKIAPYLGIKIE